MKCTNCNLLMKEYKWGFLCEECGERVLYKQPLEEGLWYDSAFDNFFSVIAHEYHSIQELLKMGKIAGAFLQMKDLLEVLLKFPVIVEIAGLVQGEKDPEDYKLLYKLLGQALSLGHWREILKKMAERKRHTIFPSDFLAAVFKMCNDEYQFADKKCDIVKWRNEKIGHGAYSTNDHKMISDIHVLLKLVKQHFDQYQQYYRQMNVALPDQETCLKGYFKAKDFEQTDAELRYQLSDGSWLSLYPFLVIRNKQIFIFDAFLYDKKKYDVLSYPVAVKTEYKKEPMQELLRSIYEECSKQQQFDSIQPENDLDIHHMLRSQEEAIMQEREKIQKVEYLNTWIKDCIDHSGEQKFLLLMESGMGKTTWTRSLAQNGRLHDIIVKTVSLNDTYRSKTTAILSKLYREVITDRDGRYLFEDSENKTIRMDADDLSDELEAFLSYYQKLYQTAHLGDRLLIIFDGLDEAGFGENRNIVHVVSNMKTIPENVYFLFTGRTLEEMGPSYEKHLELLGIAEEYTKTVYSTQECYVKLLKGFLKNRYEIKSDDLQKKILDQCDNNFAYLQLFMEIMTRSSKNIHQLPSSDEIIAGYLESMAEIYGTKYSQYFYRILHVLSVSDEPITLAELAYLLGENQITATLLGYIHDMKRLLYFDRMDGSNTLALRSGIYAGIIREYIRQNAGSIADSLEQSLAERIDGFGEEGFSYLLANVKRFSTTYQILCERKAFDEEFWYTMYEYASDLIHGFSYDKTVRGYQILEQFKDIEISVLDTDGLVDCSEEEQKEWIDILKRYGRSMLLSQLAFKWSDTYQKDGAEEFLRESAEFIEETLQRALSATYPDKITLLLKTFDYYMVVMEQFAFYMSSHNKMGKWETVVFYESLLNPLYAIGADNPELAKHKKEIYKSLLYVYQNIAATSFDDEKESALRCIEELQTEIDQMAGAAEEADTLEQIMDKLGEISYQLHGDSEKASQLLTEINRIYKAVDEELKACTDGSRRYRICEAMELIALIYMRVVAAYYDRQADYRAIGDYVNKGGAILDKLATLNYKIKNELYSELFFRRASVNEKFGKFDACIEDNRKLLQALEKGGDIGTETEYNRYYIRYCAYAAIAVTYQKLNPPQYKEACVNMLEAAVQFKAFSGVYKTGGMTDADFRDQTNNFLDHVLRLQLAIELNTGDQELAGTLSGIFLEAGIDPELLKAARERSRSMGTGMYVIVDHLNGEFILCSGNQQPKKTEYDEKEGVLRLDFKRKCNQCIFRDCKGYRQSGTFTMKVRGQ